MVVIGVVIFNPLSLRDNEKDKRTVRAFPSRFFYWSSVARIGLEMPGQKSLNSQPGTRIDETYRVKWGFIQDGEGEKAGNAGKLVRLG